MGGLLRGKVRELTYNRCPTRNRPQRTTTGERRDAFGMKSIVRMAQIIVLEVLIWGLLPLPILLMPQTTYGQKWGFLALAISGCCVSMYVLARRGVRRAIPRLCSRSALLGAIGYFAGGALLSVIDAIATTIEGFRLAGLAMMGGSAVVVIYGLLLRRSNFEIAGRTRAANSRGPTETAM